MSCVTETAHIECVTKTFLLLTKPFSFLQMTCLRFVNDVFTVCK